MGLLDLFKKAQGKYSLNWIISQNSWIFPENNGSSYINEGYKNLPNVYSIISLITQKSSLVPFEVYKIKNKGKYNKYKSLMQLAKTTQDFANIVRYKNEAFDKVENSDIEKLLLTPNNQQSTQELWESLDGYKLLTGNSYLFGLTPGLGLNATKPKELYSIPSPMVSIIPISVFEGVKGYKFTFIAEEIQASEIAHFKFWNPIVTDAALNDIFYGQSPLQACRMLMGKYKDADITQGSMFKNQGPAGILAGDNGTDLTETQALSIKDKFKQVYQGANKAGDIIVTPAKLTWQQIGLSPVDLNIIEGKADMLSELCNAYHVPIGLFSAKNSTENNMIESRKMLITDAVIPLVESRKGVLNRWLQAKFGNEYLVEFDYTVFNEIQEDLSKLATTANAMYWTSPNEKRAMTSYDQHPDPLMDKLYFPSGLTLLEDLNGGLTDIDETLLNDEKYFKNSNFDPSQPRDDDGKWTDGSYPKITKDNFYVATLGRFERTDKPNRTPDYVSLDKNGNVSSAYWYTKDGVIRESDHWGDVASTTWLIDKMESKYYHQTGDVKIFNPPAIGKISFLELEKNTHRVLRANDEYMSVMVSQLKKQGVESFRDLDKTNPEIIAAALKRREATIIP